MGEEQTAQATKEKGKPSQAHGFAIGEMCFILLPFIVMAITFTFKSCLEKILNQPEWSLAASVMFGQTIIKMIHTMGKLSGRGHVNQYNLGAVISIIILVGLVPSLTILSLIFTSEILPPWLITFQLVLFILGAIVFYIANAIQISVEEDQK